MFARCHPAVPLQVSARDKNMGSYSLLNMEEVQTRRGDFRGHKWYRTCVCDKSQHQHGNGKIQSHLGYDFLRRNRGQFVV